MKTKFRTSYWSQTEYIINPDSSKTENIFWCEAFLDRRIHQYGISPLKQEEKLIYDSAGKAHVHNGQLQSACRLFDGKVGPMNNFIPDVTYQRTISIQQCLSDRAVC